MSRFIISTSTRAGCRVIERAMQKLTLRQKLILREILMKFHDLKEQGLSGEEFEAASEAWMTAEHRDVWDAYEKAMLSASGGTSRVQ